MKVNTKKNEWKIKKNPTLYKGLRFHKNKQNQGKNEEGKGFRGGGGGGSSYSLN